MKMHLQLWQKLLILFVCFVCAVIGFMLKLPAAFRGIDRELHAAFYFLAAAFLNILFAGRNFFKHVIIFIVLGLFGMAIEYAQEYSNKFFRRRIHGRFDPEDLEWNIKGLIAFSVVWIIFVLLSMIFKRTKLGDRLRTRNDESW